MLQGAGSVVAVGNTIANGLSKGTSRANSSNCSTEFSSNPAKGDTSFQKYLTGPLPWAKDLLPEVNACHAGLFKICVITYDS
ncbi:hypothetical protein GCM10007415_06620 [Parapedobacter pyrenivorans]|uniref:Uncharacterized protein n=1 Tax=Parapedobacter pyrenivorans TaxID=1305674 RepID=A0A917HG41_9SPHI|nr:hypothetical protein GCM10007415_06620 [Parapedobacter pyrenivorans]